MCQSEVARIRQQIALEIEAMNLGMSGLATGCARHDFIHARMERIGACHDDLARHVGEANANHIVCQLYMHVMEPEVAFNAGTL